MMMAFPILLVIIIPMVCFGQENNQIITADYIIVGGGSCGATVAGRLSEDSSVEVLLLEAGPPPPKDSEIPLLAIKYGENTAINWNYTIERDDRSCRGSNITNSCPYYMGRTLGGTSQINGLMYVRGNKLDYDLWEEVYGADGWNCDDVLPYFKKAEGLTITDGVIDEDYHGRNGPLTVSYNSYNTVIAPKFIEAFEGLGFDDLDYNGKNQTGVSFTQVTARDGYKCSSEKAYLQPAYNRSNLQIITSALVTKIIIESKVATGVFYIKDGQTLRANARREVIISAGVMKSPQLLMLSGIGPKDQLDKLNIEVVSDLPGVGQNLQDHITAHVLIYQVEADGVPTVSDIFNYTTLPSYDFPEKLTGYLSANDGLEVTAFAKSPYETKPGDYNDIQIFALPNMAFQTFWNAEITAFLSQYFDVPTIAILPAPVHPLSFGNVSLRSKDPTDPPLIYMNYFSDPQDMEVLIYSMNEIKKIAGSKAMSQFKPKLIGPLPGCENFDLDSDDYLECASRLVTVSVYHACGTCKMGRVEDPSTVVDPYLRVKGVKGLRVADASIMPRIVSGNINAPVIMIGEKAADMIKSAYKNEYGGYQPPSSSTSEGGGYKPASSSTSQGGGHQSSSSTTSIIYRK